MNVRAAAAGVVTAIIAAGAAAQTSTVMRFADPPWRVPGSVTVLGQGDLDRRGVESLGQLRLQVPALDAGAALPGFTLRGVGGRIVGPASEPGFAVRQGGVVSSRTDIADMGFFDLERLELARGPQGVLYGRNTAGGILNLVPRRPEERFAADLDFEYGSFAALRLRSVLNAPLPDESSALRVAVQHREHDELYRLFSADRRTLARDDTAVRTAFSSRLAETLRLDFAWTYWRTDAGDSAAVPLAAFTSPTTDDRRFGLDLDRSVHFGTLALAWRVADFLLTFSGGYQSHDSHARAGDGDTGAATPFDDVHAWSSDLEILFEDGGPFRFAFGAGYFDETNEGSGTNADSEVSPRLFATAANRTFDTFADGSYQMFERLRIRGGVHLSYTHRDFDDRSRLTADTPADDFDSDATWSSLTWRAGLDLDVTADHLLYALVSTGNRPGGFDFLARDSYKEEEVLAVELGGKGAFFSERLRWNLAGFRYDYTDIQARVALAPATLPTVANLPAAEIFGVETEWLAEPLERLLLNGTFGWLKTRYSEDFAVESRPEVLQSNSESIALNLKGRKLSRSPATSLNLGIQYTCDLQRFALPGLLHGALTARFDYTHRAAIFFDTTLQHRQGPWDSADLRLLYDKRFAPFDLTAEAFVRNLWDERVKTNEVGLAAGPPDLAFYDPPRTYGFRLTTRWR